MADNNSKCGRILIVEDDINLCLAISDFLCERGFETAVAGDGIKALHELEQADPLPNLIVLDLHMPNMSGWQLREQLKHDARYCCIPILIISGDQACVDVEADAHLLKPFELDDFDRLMISTLKH